MAFLPKCTGPITYIGKAELDAECAALKAAVRAWGRGAVTPFLTAASPGILASIVKNEHYPSFDAQIDAPDLALERHVAFSKRPLKDFQQFVDRVIAAINTCLLYTSPSPRDRG